MVGIYGTIEREGEVVHLVVGRITDLSHLLGRLPTSSRDF
jgi:error-prone DNA polymerase